MRKLLIAASFAGWLAGCEDPVRGAPPATLDDAGDAAQDTPPPDSALDVVTEPGEPHDGALDSEAGWDAEAEAAGPPVELLEALQGIEGMKAWEETSSVYGCRFFRLVYDQPANHDEPLGVRFGQRLALIHCSTGYPMVLATTGYSLWGETEPWELTAMLRANQLVVEHRFFDPSIPESPGWTDLTIRNAAADHHRIVQALRPLYPAKWISTGASKGGMTSVYHRRFYPDDVDATVAYVAPHSHGVSDDRYALFLEQVGEAGCRDKLKALQREVLLRKPAMLQRMKDLASQTGATYTWLGLEQAFEHAVTEFWFYFWQYSDSSLCGSIPAAGGTDDELFVFLDQISPMDSVADAAVEFFGPYFYQAATQLGAPGQADGHFVDLLQYPGTDVPATYAPKGWPLEFDAAAMLEVEAWLSSEGKAMMFIYGENDPWSAAPFPLGNAQDSYLFVVPGGNHYAQVQGLASADRAQALAAIEKWTGVKPKAAPPVPSMLKPMFRPPL